MYSCGICNSNIDISNDRRLFSHEINNIISNNDISNIILNYMYDSQYIYDCVLHDKVKRICISCQNQQHNITHCNTCNQVRCNDQCIRDNPFNKCSHCNQQYCDSCIKKCISRKCKLLCCALCSIKCVNHSRSHNNTICPSVKCNKLLYHSRFTFTYYDDDRHPESQRPSECISCNKTLCTYCTHICQEHEYEAHCKCKQYLCDQCTISCSKCDATSICAKRLYLPYSDSSNVVCHRCLLDLLPLKTVSDIRHRYYQT